MNNDLISREALREAFLKRIFYFNKSSWDEANALIENAPTVELSEEQAIDKLHETGWMIEHDKEMTRRPTGKWIDRIADKGYVECPFCHKQITGGDLNFCVKCGADMRVKDELNRVKDELEEADMRGSVKQPSNGKEKKTLTEAFMEDVNRDDVDYNELCYRTGHRMTMCDCEFCDHRHECSGYQGEEE